MDTHPQIGTLFSQIKAPKSGQFTSTVKERSLIGETHKPFLRPNFTLVILVSAMPASDFRHLGTGADVRCGGTFNT